MFKTTFDDVLIEQNDDSKELIFETSFEKIEKLVTDLIDLQIDSKNSVLEEISQLITLEMTSNRDFCIATASNASTIDQIHIVIQFDSKIIEIQIASKAAQHFSIDSISDVQIRFESMNSQAKFDSSNSRSKRAKAKSSNDFVTMNTRSRTRKQTYATTLITVNQLNSYFATFSIELQRLNIISVVLKLHKDDLSIESRY
jgi:hypothetical protein